MRSSVADRAIAALAAGGLALALPLVARAEGEGETEGASEGQRPYKPQNNEVEFNGDAIFAKPSNASHLTLQYAWIPGAYNKNDEVVPVLRRFVRHPTELFARFDRRSDQLETATGLIGGGRAALGPLHAFAEVGLEYIEIENDVLDGEANYLAAIAHAELTARPLDLLGVGGFYQVRPIINAFASDGLGPPAEREGLVQEVGGKVIFATPNDRLLLDARLGWRALDYTFSGFHSGDLTTKGLFADVRLNVQISPQIGFYVHAVGARTAWESQRISSNGGTEANDVDLDEEVDVTSIDVDLGYVYWFEGRWGFRVSLGGGYVDKRPVYEADQTGKLRLGVGFVSRY